MSVTIQELPAVVENMRAFARNNSVDARITALKRLKIAIKEREDKILDAIKCDFNKPEFDSYITEVGICYNEINYFIKHLKKLAKPKRVSTSVNTFPSKGRIYAEPYGVVLVIAPWNFPFQLAMMPLIGAIAAGNAVVLKPASATKATAKVLDEIINAAFDKNQASVFCGSRQNAELLQIRYDYIFFTGGTVAAKTIMHAAAEHLTPLSLELGGKSPCIVDESADVKIAAKRIAWGKFFNAGQVCVAPDYLLVHERVYDAFVKEFIEQIKTMYFDGDLLKDNFPYLVNEGKGESMREILSDAEVLFGGEIQGRKMQPTVVKTDFDGAIMRDEVFAPVAPIIKFSKFEDIAQKITCCEKPLALYYYGKNATRALKLSFGGGCINDCIMHVGEGKLPFGGVGFSGMGRYHEKASFDTFTHYKSVLVKGKCELPVRYGKTEKNLSFIRKIMK